MSPPRTKLPLVSHYQWNSSILSRYLGALAQLGSGDADCGIERAFDVDGDTLARAAVCQAPEIRTDSGDSSSSVSDMGKVGLDFIQLSARCPRNICSLLHVRDLVIDDIEVAEDIGEGVIDLVSDAGGECAATPRRHDGHAARSVLQRPDGARDRRIANMLRPTSASP